jgi:hypothetical protein
MLFVGEVHMLQSRVLRALVLCGLTLGVGKLAHAAQYPLKCQGGTAFQYRSAIEGDPAAKYAVLYFNKGTQGYDGAILPLGTCSWQDRGLKPNEPHCIAFTVSGLDLTTKPVASGIHMSIQPKNDTEKAFRDAADGATAMFYVEGPFLHVNSTVVEPAGNCFQAVLK